MNHATICANCGNTQRQPKRKPRFNGAQRLTKQLVIHCQGIPDGRDVQELPGGSCPLWITEKTLEQIKQERREKEKDQ